MGYEMIGDKGYDVKKLAMEIAARFVKEDYLTESIPVYTSKRCF